VIHSYYLSFPVLHIAVFAAVATAGLPYLARGVRRIIEIFIALVALACAVGGHGLPLNVLGNLTIGSGLPDVMSSTTYGQVACASAAVRRPSISAPISTATALRYSQSSTTTIDASEP
jgi:hypothetical protein